MSKSLLLVLVALSLSIQVLYGQPDEGGLVFEHNVTMRTRDGVALKADVYRPAGDGSFPVLLQRTPYNKDAAAEFSRKAVARGFMVVVQDVRGRYTSEGEWYTFKHETDDGYDAVEWAATLPHSNGKVGMWGGSYVGATQMLAAIGHPPHLAGICPVVTASNYHENWTYQGGAFEQWFDESWSSGLAQDTLDRIVREDTNALRAVTVLPMTEYSLFNNMPMASGAALTKQLAPYFIDWLAHPTYDSYWKQWSIEENYDKIGVPALTIAAWYDIFQGGSLRNYIGMRDHAGNDAARSGQRLLVTIGGHAGSGRKVGDVDFGPDAEFDEGAVTLDWYDYLFLGKQNRFADAAHPVRIFVMGRNQWRDEQSWPISRSREARYYLDSSGKANSASGDGRLLTTEPGGGMPDSFVYDPANPVPTVGGPLCCDSVDLMPGPRDQKDVEARKDVLVYSTPPLDTDIEVSGPIALHLFAKTSAVDTDFTAKLVDVWPNGFAQNLTEGILRAGYRDSTLGLPAPVSPGSDYEYKIDLWSTSNVFLKGHRIRLEISSSNFPRFDRNLNTGKTAADSAEFVKATNIIEHSRMHPSVLILPILP
jgi:uncharacterized protein